MTIYKYIPVPTLHVYSTLRQNKNIYDRHTLIYITKIELTYVPIYIFRYMHVKQDNNTRGRLCALKE